jgi:hypothetical protein
MTAIGSYQSHGIGNLGNEDFQGLHPFLLAQIVGTYHHVSPRLSQDLQKEVLIPYLASRAAASAEVKPVVISVRSSCAT